VRSRKTARNKEGRERDEEAVAVGRDAGPIGIAGDEKIKGKEGSEKGSAGATLPSPENKKASDREKENGRPGDKSVIGGEKHFEKDGRKPEPLAERSVTGFERASVNEKTRDESGQQTSQEDGREKRMPEEEVAGAQSGTRLR
jgi:hypothetical protein